MNLRRIIGLFFLIEILISCVKTAPVVIPAPSESTNHHFKLHEKLRTIFPEKCTFSARVIVTFAGKEMDFITYTVMNGTDIRSKAMGEFGGTLFDFLYLNGKVILLTFPEQIPKNIVKKGPSEDLYHIFYMSRKITPIDACGENCIFILSEKQHYHVFEFSPQGILLCSRVYLKQKLISEVYYNDWKILNPSGKTVPGKLTLVHHDPVYRIDMTILDLASEIHTLEVFKPPAKIK